MSLITTVEIVVLPSPLAAVLLHGADVTGDEVSTEELIAADEERPLVVGVAEDKAAVVEFQAAADEVLANPEVDAGAEELLNAEVDSNPLEVDGREVFNAEVVSGAEELLNAGEEVQIAVDSGAAVVLNAEVAGKLLEVAGTEEFNVGRPLDVAGTEEELRPDVDSAASIVLKPLDDSATEEFTEGEETALVVSTTLEGTLEALLETLY